MRLTTKGRFAVTAMIDLGLREQRGPVTLAGISQRQQISLSYLEQLFAKLRRHGLVTSTRGPGGGYRLGKPADTITAADIVYAVDELQPTPYGNAHESAESDQAGSMRELWASLDRQMIDFLDGVTLRDLIAKQRIEIGSRGVERHALVARESDVTSPDEA